MGAAPRTGRLQRDLGPAHWVEKTEDLAFLNEVSCVPLQQALRHPQTAFANFWAKRTKYPSFKSKKRSRRSAEYTASAFRWREGRLTLAKMAEPLNIVWSRPLPAGCVPSTVTVSQDAAGRWFVSLLCEDMIEQTPAIGSVGIDAGLDSLLTLSTSEKITNPRYERADRQRLARAQRALARKQNGSTTGPSQPCDVLGWLLYAAALVRGRQAPGTCHVITWTGAERTDSPTEFSELTSNVYRVPWRNPVAVNAGP